MKEPLYDREGMARMIRTYFIEHKSHGRKYRPNPRHDSQENWLKAADVCIAQGANPADWVAASFALSKFEPFANQLAGPSAIARWKEYTHKDMSPPTTKEDYGQAESPEPAVAPFSRLTSAVGITKILETQVMSDIKDELILAHILLKQASGSSYAKDNHSFLLDRFTSIRPHVRVAIAGRAGLTDVVVKFRQPASDFFSKHPHHTECFCALGYDIKTYLNVT